MLESKIFLYRSFYSFILIYLIGFFSCYLTEFFVKSSSFNSFDSTQFIHGYSCFPKESHVHKISKVKGSCWCEDRLDCVCAPSISAGAFGYAKIDQVKSSFHVFNYFEKDKEIKMDDFEFENKEVFELTNRCENMGFFLIERRNEPFGLAIIGGFIDGNESPEIATVREYFEETHLVLENLKLLDVITDPFLDYRRHTTSVIYSGFVNESSLEGMASNDDAKAIYFIPLLELFEKVSDKKYIWSSSAVKLKSSLAFKLQWKSVQKFALNNRCK